MNREWKPGDIATLEINGETVRAMVDRDHCWLIFGHSFFKGIRVGNDTLISDVRPLVVIDPEDREQVERLAHLAFEGEGKSLERDTNLLRAALCEFANPQPPKPEEPQGLGAVVEDEEGADWHRTRDGRWIAEDGLRSRAAGWNHIAAMKVLSEGVVV